MSGENNQQKKTSKLTDDDLKGTEKVTTDTGPDQENFVPKFGVKILASEDFSEIKILPNFTEVLDEDGNVVEVETPYDVMKYLLKDSMSRIESKEMTEDIQQAVISTLVQGAVPVKNSLGIVENVSLLRYLSGLIGNELAKGIASQAQSQGILHNIGNLKP